MSNFLETVDYQSDGANEAFVKSLHETGFGVLKNHPIAEAQVRAIYDNWQAFFNSDRKSDYNYNVGTQDGFFSSKISEVAKDHTVKDIKEYFHFYPWGQCPEDLSQELQTYYSQTSSLASELLGWVEEFSPEAVRAGYRESLPNMIKGSEQTLLRVLHYPPFDGNEEPGAIRAAAHGDINLLTILPAASEPGLQVLSKTGEWLDVPAEFGHLIVNIGDMLQEASAGYFPSTIHRVINPVGGATKKSRISLPLFLHPRPDVVLSDRYTADSYLKERLKELGVI